jgi:DNA-binding NtrC family response regulator
MFSKKAPLTISHDEMERLKTYDWPGNIRELSNIIERSVILGNSNEINPSRLIQGTAPKETADPEPGITSTTASTLREVEEAHIRNILDFTGWNYTRASKLLGISRSTLMRKIMDYDLKKEI